MTKAGFIAGCGCIGRPLALSSASATCQTCPITASELTASRRRSTTFRVQTRRLTDRASFRRLPLRSSDIVVHCASSSRGDASAYEAVYLHGTQNLLDYFHPRNFVLAGSTSVYAQTDGSWVNEQSPALPSRETAKILRKTE